MSNNVTEKSAWIGCAGLILAALITAGTKMLELSVETRELKNWAETTAARAKSSAKGMKRDIQWAELWIAAHPSAPEVTRLREKLRKLVALHEDFLSYTAEYIQAVQSGNQSLAHERRKDITNIERDWRDLRDQLPPQ